MPEAKREDKKAARLKNVYLPLSFWKVLMEKGRKGLVAAEQKQSETAKKPKPYTDSDISGR